VKTDEFEFVETVNALSKAIGLLAASTSPEASGAFIGSMRELITSSEPNTIRWRVYRQILREVTGSIEDDSNTLL